MIYGGFHFLSTFYSILLGHLANNFNFLLRSEFWKVMYCCIVNESPNNLQENAICKSFPNITVTQPFSLRGPGGFWKIPVPVWASHEASVGRETDRESELISVPSCGTCCILVFLRRWLVHTLNAERCPGWHGSSHCSHVAGQTQSSRDFSCRRWGTEKGTGPSNYWTLLYAGCWVRALYLLLLFLIHTTLIFNKHNTKVFL